jgi:COMM domain containing 9
MSALTALMGAKNKTILEEVFAYAFHYRGDLSYAPADKVADGLGIKQGEVRAVLEAARHVIAKSLYSASAQVDYQAIYNCCDPSLDDKLKKLIAKTVGRNLLDWKADASRKMISWPRMVDMNWQVDVKVSSQQMSRMHVPTVVLDLKVKEQPRTASEPPAVKSVNFELSKESLGTLIDGMHKIRDQLGALSRT